MFTELKQPHVRSGDARAPRAARLNHLPALMLLLPSFLGGFPDVEKFAVALLAGWKEGNPVGLAPFF